MDIEEKNKFTKYLFLCLLPILLSSFGCNINKHLKSDESLIKKNDIVIKSDNKVKNKRGLKYELSTIIKQKPNRNWLGMKRGRLKAYYKVQDPGDTTKFDNWLRRVIAEKPTLYNKQQVESTAQSMQYYLQHKGYNDAIVTDTVRHKRKRKRSIVTYTAYLNNIYKIDSVFFLSKDEKIKKILYENTEETLLKKGEPVSKSLFDKEHLRLTDVFQNAGYAYFNNSYFYAEGDTSNYKVNVYYEVLKPAKQDEHQVYYIGDITVIPDYDPLLPKPAIDTMINGIRFLKRNQLMKVKPKNIIKGLFLKTGDLYKEKNYIKTNLQLRALDIYRRVNIEPQVDPNDPSKLNFIIRLTAKKRMVFGADIELNNSTYNSAQQNSLLGMAGSVNFRHRNIMRSAFSFLTELQGGVALDLGNNDQLFYSIDLKAQGDLVMPRFVDPIRLWKFLKWSHLIYPEFYTDLKEKGRTRLSAGYNYLSLFEFYNYNSFSFSFGYDLKRNSSNRYLINQIGVDYLLTQSKPNFDTILINNPFLRNSFDNQLFTGALFRDLDYTYRGKTNKYGASWYYNLNVELSGGEVFLSNAIYNRITNTDTPFRLFNRVDYAQFASVGMDLRYYKKISNSQALAFRLFGGLARPFGFTEEVPYTKQFYSGGPNSIRGWRIRELGPGQYVEPTPNPPVNSNSAIPFYQTGDIQLEFNAEYRFDIFWFFEGALFLDAGNIWTFKEDPDRVGSQFRFSQKRDGDGNIVNDVFTKQIAVSSGLGIRGDFTYFIIRFDLGLKMRTPYTDPNNNDRYWRFNELKNTTFRNGINYNLAIGYPF